MTILYEVIQMNSTSNAFVLPSSLVFLRCLLLQKQMSALDVHVYFAHRYLLVFKKNEQKCQLKINPVDNEFYLLLSDDSLIYNNFDDVSSFLFDYFHSKQV